MISTNKAEDEEKQRNKRVIESIDRCTPQNRRIRHLLVVVHVRIRASMERLDLRLDAFLALCVGEPCSLVLECFRFPVLCLVGRLERWVLADCRVCILINFLDVITTNAISEVSRELLLETGGILRY